MHGLFAVDVPLSVELVPMVQPVKVNPAAVGVPTRIELAPLGPTLTEPGLVTTTGVPTLAPEEQLVSLKRVNGTDMLGAVSGLVRCRPTLPSVNVVVVVPDVAPVAVTRYVAMNESGSVNDTVRSPLSSAVTSVSYDHVSP